jgi:hypothetical protein
MMKSTCEDWGERITTGKQVRGISAVLGGIYLVIISMKALTAKCASSKVLQWLCNDHMKQVVHTRNSTSSLPPAALRARSMTANPTPFSSIHSNKIIDTPSDSTCSAEGVKFDAGVEDGSESK